NALALVGSGLLYNGQPGIAPSTVGNDNLTWESMKTLNVGISTRVFDRFSVELEFYNRQTDDMLMGYPLSYTT
ncbi:TonB-dependent receptor, partial [Dorea formicigenerans]